MKQIVYRYSLPLTTGGQREGLLIRLESKTGDVGWGEVAPLPGFSQETLDDAIQALLLRRLSPYPSVQWGKASAILDLLFPLTIDAIPVRKLGTEKIKVGHLSLNEAVRSVKETGCCGVDMNQQWTLEQALSLAEACPQIQYFEEPLKPGEHASQFPYPVALDESLRNKKIPPYPCITMHTIKPTLYGYPLPPVVKGVDFILSSSYESPLGLYQIAKLAYRLNLPLYPMGLGTMHLFADSLFEKAPYYDQGCLHFPQEWRLKKNHVEVLFDGSI